MSNHLRSIQVRNYRSLADVPLGLRPINVLFGPNGAGKSSFLDVIWFVRDCAIRGVDQASASGRIEPFAGERQGRSPLSRAHNSERAPGVGASTH
jgi:AAA15 family ATPase/GTPase